jgi:hypothetical protein
MKRWVTALVVVLVLVGGLAIGVRVLWSKATSGSSADSCTFGSYTTDTGQASVAATMVGVTLQRELPERAALLVLMAGWQESKLRNIPAGQGDLDSVGVLQQRPSQGWGSEAELSDVATATGKFLDALVKVSNWESDDPATVIQEVQVSADGSAYAKHEPKSTAMADALTGAQPRGVTCSFSAPSQIATASTVASLVAAQLPISAPQSSGKTITVPGAAWATAAWFVSNADRLGINTVSYAGHEWSRKHGWQTDAAATDTGVTAILAS